MNRDGKQWTDDREFAARMVERVDYWGEKTVELLARSGMKQGDYRQFMRSLEPGVRFTHPQRGDAAKPKGNVVTDLREVARFFARN